MNPRQTPPTTKKSSLLPHDERVIEGWWSRSPRKSLLLETDGMTLWFTSGDVRIPVAVWRSEFHYDLPSVGGYHPAEVVQMALKKFSLAYPMSQLMFDTQRTRRTMTTRMATEKEAFGAMTARDERVIDLWWECKPAEGDALFSDGETLSGMWDIPRPIAVWQGWGTFKMVPTLNPKVKRVQDEVRLMRPMDDDEIRLAGGASPMEVWEKETPTFKHAITPAFMLKIRRAIRNPAAVSVFSNLNLLQNVSRGAPSPETPFFMAFRQGMKALGMHVKRGARNGDEVVQGLMDSLSQAAPYLKKIDAGHPTSRTFLDVSRILVEGLSKALGAFGVAAKPVVLPGAVRFVGMAPSSEDAPMPQVPDEVVNVFTRDEQSLPTEAAQPDNDIDSLYRGVVAAEGHQLDLLNRGTGLDSRIGARVVYPGEKVDMMAEKGPVIMIGPRKKKERVIEKVTSEGKGVDSALDLVRSTVAVDSLDDLAKVVSELRAMGIVFARKPKNRFNSPTSVGYRDLMFNVRYPNGHVGEIQVNLKSMLEAKNAGHRFYEQVRSLDAAKKLSGDPTLTAEEQATVDLANQTQKNLYDEAWRQAAGSGSLKFAAGDFTTGVSYYLFNDSPARVARGSYPILMNKNGAEVVYYDQQKFYQEAQRISEAEYNSRVTVILKRRVLKNATLQALPEDPWRYFIKKPGTVLIPISSLVPTRARESGIQHANELMMDAYNGRGQKRGPISIGDNHDGTYTVLDGNSTYANAKMSGWKSIPAIIENVSHTASSTGESDLRSKLIRLASENPELRPVLLPLLTDGVKTAAKAPKPAPKLKGKKLDDAISKAYYRHGDGVQVNIMDISKIYEAGKKAYEAADTVEAADAALDAAMKDAIAKFRQN